MKKVAIYHALDAVPAAYADLFNDSSSSSSFFLNYSWFRNLSDTATSKNTRLRIYGVESATENDKPSLALLMRHQIGVDTKIRVRHLTAFANFYTSLFSPIGVARSSCADEDIRLLIASIAQDSPRWDHVTLSPLDVNSSVFNQLTEALRACGMAVQKYFCFGNWYLQVNGRSYQEYFDALPSRLRNTIVRKSRLLERAGRLRIEVVSNECTAASKLFDYEKIHGASWKEKEPFPQFIPGLVALCAREGWLRMGIAYVDEQPAAAQIWITHNAVASIYKLAYDERFSQLSIGSILTARMMQQAIDVDKVAEVDYLTGDEPYKRDWMSHRRERWGIMAFNLRTVHGIFGALRHIGGRAVRDFIGGRPIER